MRCLELFAGTGSVGDVFKEVGWEVVSLDRDMPADIQTDIMDWNYRSYEPGTFDIIWASPPCTEYSIAKTVGTRKIEDANAVTMRTLEIINYLQPRYWIVENPQTGYMKSQPFMQDLPYKDVDYCRYGMPYKKATRLWNNLTNFEPLRCNRECDQMTADRKRHLNIAQHSPGKQYPDGVRFRMQDLYRIPKPLTQYLVQCIQQDQAND
jgi:hypothetical protein